MEGERGRKEKGVERERERGGGEEKEREEEERGGESYSRDKIIILE